MVDPPLCTLHHHGSTRYMCMYTCTTYHMVRTYQRYSTYLHTRRLQNPPKAVDDEPSRALSTLFCVQVACAYCHGSVVLEREPADRGPRIHSNYGQPAVACKLPLVLGWCLFVAACLTARSWVAHAALAFPFLLQELSSEPQAALPSFTRAATGGTLQSPFVSHIININFSGMTAEETELEAVPTRFKPPDYVRFCFGESSYNNLSSDAIEKKN
jgi:hypothetical protein